MYTEKFEKAFDYVIANEGGYVFDQNDAGGETKYGISKKSYPALNIRALSLEDAKKIYYRDFWLKGKFDQIKDKNVAIQFFDFSVNFGLRAATIIVQRALRAGGNCPGRWFNRPRNAFCGKFFRASSFAGSHEIRSSQKISIISSSELKNEQIFGRLA